MKAVTEEPALGPSLAVGLGPEASTQLEPVWASVPKASKRKKTRKKTRNNVDH